MNARFWIYIKGTYVKLTLKLGQKLRWNTWEQTEEGFSAASEAWEYDTKHNRVVRDYESSGRDCDGHHGFSQTEVCDVDDLNSRLNDYIPFDCDDMFLPRYVPKWERVDCEVYDQFAQAAGY